MARPSLPRRSGRGVFEFTYTDLQQLYQANDLALVSQHLVQDPVAMTYDQRRRLLHVAMADGTLATLTLYRAEQVTAWTRQETDGFVRSLADIEGMVWAVVERAGTPRLERFDDTLALDAALDGSAAAEQDTWSGLGHLEGRSVGIVADGAPRGTAQVSGAAVTLDPPARSVQVGLPFAHEISPCRRTSPSPAAPARRRCAWSPSPSGCWRPRRSPSISAAGRNRWCSAGSAPRCWMRRRLPSPATSGCVPSAGSATRWRRSGASPTTRRCR